MKIEEVIAENLKKIRKLRELTQEEVAWKAKMQPNYYACVERAEKTLSLGSLQALAKVLKVEPYRLLKDGGWKEVSSAA